MQVQRISQAGRCCASFSLTHFSIPGPDREGEPRLWSRTNQKTQDELQWIVAQRLLSALTIPGFSYVVCKRFIISNVRNYASPQLLLAADADLTQQGQS